MEKLQPNKSTINYKRYKLKPSQVNDKQKTRRAYLPNACVKNVI